MSADPGKKACVDAALRDKDRKCSLCNGAWAFGVSSCHGLTVKFCLECAESVLYAMNNYLDGDLDENAKEIVAKMKEGPVH